MKDLLDGLNPEQLTAVTYKKGPLLIIAGAGTGKTNVITKRTAWLTEQGLAKPSEILALTFTDKAAAEMEERVDKLIPGGLNDSWIMTFDSFCNRLISDHAFDVGLSNSFTLMTNQNRVALFIENNLDRLKLKIYSQINNPGKNIKNLIQYFGKLKNEDITPHEYLNYANECVKSATDTDEKKEAEKQLELATAYEGYQDLMFEKEYLDFGDLISLTLGLLRQNNRILKNLQKQFKYVLVDEFQDTNFTQLQLLKLLAPKESNITVVGDDDQGIYSFRGAVISNIFEFSKHWDNASQIVLTKNYRSSQEILDASYKLIQNNNPERLEIKNNINKQLTEARIPKGKKISVVHFHAQDASSEADKVAQIISTKVKDGLNFNDIAILVRTKSLAKNFIAALNRLDIPVIFFGPSNLFKEKEIINLIAFTRAITDVCDSIAFFTLATSDIYKLDVNDAALLSGYGKRANIPFERIARDCEKIKELKTLSSESIIKLKQILSDIESLRDDLALRKASEIIFDFIEKTGYLKALVGKTDGSIETKTSQEKIDAEIKIKNISNFFRLVEDFETDAKDKSLFSFEEHLSILLESNEDDSKFAVDESTQAVNVLTAHSSKGLEYSMVFIVGCVNETFPLKNMSDGISIPNELLKRDPFDKDFHIQEERRLFYVAMTRAQDELILTSAENYGGKRPRKISRFVGEALGEEGVSKDFFKTSNQDFINKFAGDGKPILAEPKFWDENEPLILNVQHIDNYLKCPYAFKFKFVLEMYSVSISQTFNYGNLIHKIVELYYKSRFRGEKLKLSDLLQIYKDDWKSEGFLNDEHEKQRYEKGKITITRFFERAEKSAFIPMLTEEPFEFVFEDANGESLILKGRYDALYLESEEKLNGKSVEEIRELVTSGKVSSARIVDYKTGEVDDEKKAEEKAKSRYRRQMNFYALSWLKKTNKLPQSVTLDFLDSDITVVKEKTDKDIIEISEEINRTVEGIKNNNFEATPNKRACGLCDYKDYCRFKIL